MMAPSLIGVDVPAGKHLVWFRYKAYGSYPLLLAIGMIALLALTLASYRETVGGLIRLRARHMETTNDARASRPTERPRA